MLNATNHQTYHDLIRLIESQSGGDPAIARNFITYALSANGLVERGWTPVHSEAALVTYRLQQERLASEPDTLAHFIRGSEYGTYYVQESYLHQTRRLHLVPREQLAMGTWVKLAAPAPNVFKLADAVPGTYERAVLDLRETLDRISLFRDVSRMTDMIIDKMDGVMANLGFNAVRHQCDLEEHVSAVPGSCLMVCEYAGGGNYTVQIRRQYNVEEMWYRAIDRSNLGSVIWVKRLDDSMAEPEARTLRRQTAEAVRDALYHPISNHLHLDPL